MVAIFGRAVCVGVGLETPLEVLAGADGPTANGILENTNGEVFGLVPPCLVPEADGRAVELDIGTITGDADCEDRIPA